VLSLRRRLGLMAGLGVLLFVGSAAAFAGMRREFQDRLIERAQFEAERALERADASLEGGRELVEECSVGRTHAGVGARATLTGPTLGVDEGTAARLRASLPPAGAPARVELTRAGGGVVVAARARGDGEVVWASVAVAVPKVVQFWKGVAALLGLVFVALLAAAVDAVRVVRRAAASLESSADALAADLGAPVEQPGVRELAGVADGLRSMATKLTAAAAEREALLGALARDRRLAALGRMAGALAHEVRNPLAAIKLRVDLAREGTSTEEQRRGDLDVLGREIARLDRLVTDLLVHMRSPPVSASECDVAALAEERMTLLAHWAASHDVHVRVSGSGSCAVDRDAISRALDNLIRNAVEASPRRGVVDVGVSVREATLAIDVLDDGPGIAAAREAELFEPFFTTKPEGTGLGLSLAKAVVRAHGGDIEYSRSAGRTRFTMTIPDGHRS
jgi:signal transduction histidine kinase